MTHRLFRYTGKRDVYYFVIDQTDPEVSEYPTSGHQANAMRGLMLSRKTRTRVTRRCWSAESTTPSCP
jgi:hypothetical protein